MVHTLRPRQSRPTLLSRIAADLGAPAPVREVTVTGVSLDSRAVQAGDLYAGLPGARTHGARFAAAALAAGAVAILTDATGAELVEESGTDLPVLVHPDPRSVLGAAAALIHATVDHGLPVIGITGTNGKTTTAYLIQSALTAMGEKVGLIGTVETRIGDERVPSVRTTPEAPDLHALLATMAERGMDCCVMEVSSHALSQHRVDGVVYDLALFTNLSQDHLDFHHDMEHYFLAKAELFTPARARRGLVCIDDEWGQRLAGSPGIPMTTLATRPGVAADWTVRVDEDDSAAFVLSDGTDELHLRSALPGDFNVANTAMAAVSLILMGHAIDAVAAAVLTDPHVPGRMEQVRIREDDGRLPRVIVDYAHTPEAIHAALDALRPSTAGRLVCLTGAGGDRDREKRPAMGAAAAAADIVVVTDDNPRGEDPEAIRAAILRGAINERNRRQPDLVGFVGIMEAADRHEAIRIAIAAGCGLGPEATSDGVGPAATVAILGKGHEKGQEVAGEVLPFDDRTECEEAMRSVLARLDAGERPGEPVIVDPSTSEGSAP